MEFYMLKIEGSTLNEDFKNSFSDHLMAKNKLFCLESFFWVIIIFSVVLPLRTLAMTQD
jgi:hypothetical protein